MVLCSRNSGRSASGVSQKTALPEAAPVITSSNLARNITRRPRPFPADHFANARLECYHRAPSPAAIPGLVNNVRLGAVVMKAPLAKPEYLVRGYRAARLIHQHPEKLKSISSLRSYLAAPRGAENKGGGCGLEDGAHILEDGFLLHLLKPQNGESAIKSVLPVSCVRYEGKSNRLSTQ